MGSKSDLPTMNECVNVLKNFGVEHEIKIVSAHRTPNLMFDYAKEAKKRGLEVIVAGAGGAAHLPGMVASLTDLPVIGVPIESKTLKGIDSLLSIVQMPGGVPVATVAIGGAKNAALLAVKILALKDERLAEKIVEYRKNMERMILDEKI
ncbi:5-(carboxyamino)imidazole ribonucleotide mutase [Cetobacterium somerae]|nr:5-(carboxyamino)imidazole ribonucleotide mutase [Cetobacterium sp. 2G large]MCQ9626113.1 5-(carboxyamino)imidazole ribonucleotide mutase [Cetobacterium somerae]